MNTIGPESENSKFKATLVAVLSKVVEGMIESGQARDLPHAYSILLEGVFTPEQLEQFGVEQLFKRGPEAQELLKGIGLTRTREIFSGSGPDGLTSQ